MRIALLIVLLVAGLSALAAEDKKVTRKATVTEQVVPAHGRVAGRTIAEWGEAWWQWLLAAPNVHDPALDQSGEKCHYGQSGPVWFLAGSYGSRTVVRRCAVPADKYILFPVANALIKPLPLNDVDCAHSLDRVSRGLDGVVEPYATVNGRAVPAIWSRREGTGTCFDAAMTGRKVSAAEGFWVMLRPLPPGRHVLKFGNNEAGPARKDVTVIVTVAKGVTPRPEPWPAWPDPATWGGVQESPSFPNGVSWMGAAAIMPVTPLFDEFVVIRRFAALVTRDTRYTMANRKNQPRGWLGVTPRDVREFDARSPEIARYFNLPVPVYGERWEEDKVRLVTGSLVVHGPGQKHGIEASRDIQRFLFQALDKTVAVSDHEIRATFTARWPMWEELTSHRPPAPEPTEEQKAAQRRAIDATDARFARATEATKPAPGRTYLKAEFVGTARVSPEGLKVEQCCAGAFSVVKASRTYSYGKYYFEAELGTSTRTAATTWTNLGLVYGLESAYSEHTEQVFDHAEITRYPGGTMVGIAADLDAKRLYYHINGQWQGGAPDSSYGRPLKPARSYTAFFAVSAPDDKQQASDAWTVNFGAQAFRYPLPTGYASYDNQ